MSADRDILLVEDEAFIAIETEMALQDYQQGPVRVVSNAKAAFAYLEGATPRAALLDFNLGRGETSEALAHALLDRGIPFAFLTGYSEATMTLPDRLLAAPRFSKPCHVEEVVAWLDGK
ncbi:response regulator [Jannaschia formosa]|uniref:response regulator n=1 Tax=Jannaschia formosa TaxID=2259592 RepID=UPI000E1BC574|nr:response regulator [Jannaschia formosa]TFL16070.1 response regulator [Jannaschia formosa]